MAQITKELAIKIRNKLLAEDVTPPNGAHEKWGVYYNGQLVALFGIRRGSRKDQDHGHIPKDLNVGPRFAWELGICTKSREDYLDYLRQIGQLP